MNNERIENIVGAASQLVIDAIMKNPKGGDPWGERSVAISLIGRSPGRTIRQLSFDLDRSHAATLRLIDRLVEEGLVIREKSATDGRAVILFLTQKGEIRYKHYLKNRQFNLRKLLKLMTESEVALMGLLCEKLLAHSVRTEGERGRCCRFCDVEKCVSCPIIPGLPK